MLFVTLDDITGFGDEVDGAFEERRKAIENANNWTVTGDCNWNASGTNGYALHIPRRRGSTSFPAVCSVAITAAPSANKQGKGKARLRIQSGEDLSDGDEVDVWSNFTRSVAVGIRLEIADNGDGTYRLIGADCPPTSP